MSCCGVQIAEEQYENTQQKEWKKGERGNDWKGWSEAWPPDWCDSMGGEVTSYDKVGRPYKPEEAKKKAFEEGSLRGGSLVWDTDKNDPDKKIVMVKTSSTPEGRELFKPPAYYAESSTIPMTLKACILPFVGLAAYMSVFDSLASVNKQNFIPCNEKPCRYMRVFNSANIPGTGRDIMRIQNGISRPIAMQTWNIYAYPCPKLEYNSTGRSWKSKMWTDRAACSKASMAEIPELLRTDKELAEAVHEENRMAELLYGGKMAWSPVSLITRTCFWFNKAFLGLFVYFPSLFAKKNHNWGMDQLTSAKCPGLNKTAMQAMCAKPETKAKIVNHLAVWSPSRLALVGNLGLFASFRAIHDLSLYYGVRETITLKLSYAATFAMGCAAAALFLWAMGSTGVFIAKPEGHEGQDCLCYYSVPTIVALGSIGTPFYLLYLFAGRIQLDGMAVLYGDFHSSMSFYVPHYLAKQSYLWTWLVMVSPKVAGTYKAEKRKAFLRSEWNVLFQIHRMMYYFRALIYVYVAFTAAPFIMGMMELLCDIVTGHDEMGMEDYGDIVPNVMRMVLPLFSVLAIGAGYLGFQDCWNTCIKFDEGETFADQLNLALPDELNCGCFTIKFFDKTRADWLREHKKTETGIAGVIGSIWLTLLAVTTLSVAWGLSPRLDVLFGYTDKMKDHHSLAENELVSACGFMFVAAHVTQFITFLTATWDDMESMRNISQDRDLKGDKVAASGSRVAPEEGAPLLNQSDS